MGDNFTNADLLDALIIDENLNSTNFVEFLFFLNMSYIKQLSEQRYGASRLRLR